MKQYHLELLKLLYSPIDLPLSLNNEESIIAIANKEQVLFSLAKKLVIEQNAPVSDQLTQYLNDLWHIQGKRQQRCLAQIHELTRLFNSVGLKPLYIKGAAALLQAWYDEQAERFFIDIDILFHDNDISKAYALLLDHGYQCIQADVQKGHHHLPALHHKTWPLTIELHHQPLPARAGYFLMADELFTEAQAFEGLGEYFLPSLEHSLALVVAANEFGLYGNKTGRIHAKHALDTVVLWQKINSQKLDILTDCQRNLVINFCSVVFGVVDYRSSLDLHCDNSRAQRYNNWLKSNSALQLLYYKICVRFSSSYLMRRYKSYSRNKWIYFCLQEACGMMRQMLSKCFKLFYTPWLSVSKNK